MSFDYVGDAFRRAVGNIITIETGVILLPCPFCGHEAKVHTNKTRIMVCCTNCMAVMHQRLKDPLSAIQMWNARGDQKQNVAELTKTNIGAQ